MIFWWLGSWSPNQPACMPSAVSPCCPQTSFSHRNLFDLKVSSVRCKAEHIPGCLSLQSVGHGTKGAGRRVRKWEDSSQYFQHKYKDQSKFCQHKYEHVISNKFHGRKRNRIKHISKWCWLLFIFIRKHPGEADSPALTIAILSRTLRKDFIGVYYY